MSRSQIGITIVILLSLMGTACNLFERKPAQEVVARVNDSYLYKKDIADLISKATSAEDSALLVSNYINRWATQKLLIDRAKINISIQKQLEFEKLVENYRNELYAKAYTDIIISKQLDTAINPVEVKEYYEKNGSNFKLSEDLVKLRYINLRKENNDFDEVKKRFRRFEEEDKQFLLNKTLQFNSYSLNDSVWVKNIQVYDKIKPITAENNSEILKKGSFIQLEDSLGVYLVSVVDVRLRDEQAPLEYSLPTIKQILLNQQKLELIKNLEKDITQDAIKNDEFEIYN